VNVLHIDEQRGAAPARRSVWEMGCVAVAMAFALVLGFSNLGAPSLWHDEAVQVLVARSIAETGRALLPSGQPHPVAPVFNGVMAAFIALFGDSETAVRAPSVLFAAINVLLMYLLARPLLGRPAAVMAAFALALSPWSVAWARQARFYTAQQTFYLLTLLAGWRMVSSETVSSVFGYGVAALCAYLLGIGTSLHSILFLSPIAAYALCKLAYQKELKSRWSVICVLAALAGLLTLLAYYLVLPARDAAVVFGSARPPVVMGDPGQTSPLYYVSWLYGNLGIGFFLLAMLGFLLMVLREKERGWFAALAFWIPLLALSILIGYRRIRFLLFAFPFYTMAFSYGIVVLTEYVLSTREKHRGLHAALAFWVPVLALSVLMLWPSVPIGYRPHRFPLDVFPFYAMAYLYGIVVFTEHVLSTWGWRPRLPWHQLVLSVFIVSFGLRLAVSAISLATDSINVARGADTTLATRHPQYRKPCLYVREHLAPDVVVIADTYVTVLYYVGRVDNWFPSKYLPWEAWEIGNEGLRTVDDLKAYMAEHPRGYFLAEWYRFQHFEAQKEERDWVNAHMKRIDKASSGDVTLYAWGS
jgi:uncharacterized membrane protein